MAGEIVFIGGGNMGRALLGGLIADVAPTTPKRPANGRS